MKTRTMKILTTIFSVLIMVAMLGTVVFAGELTPGQLKPINKGTEGITNLGQRIMGLVQAVGIVLAVVVLMILGIKYMMGSAEDKAEYKKSMIPYLIGAVLIFAGVNIADIIYNSINNLNA